MASAGFQIGRLNVGDESPFKPAAQPIFQRDQGFRRTIAGHHDLLAVAVQRVEGVEEFFLRRFLAGDELNVVDQQHVDRAILVAEGRGVLGANGVDEFVGELFR